MAFSSRSRDRKSATGPDIKHRIRRLVPAGASDVTKRKKKIPHPGSPLRYDSGVCVLGPPKDTTRIIIGK